MIQLPYIEKKDGLHTLYVDGRPYIALGGEIHNSSSSNLEYMEVQVWPNLREMHLNTVIIPVYWELIEPAEGSFDFQIVDGLIAQARREQVRLVFLWFGLWKNGVSDYVPAWVKRDYQRFFRACYVGGVASDTISPLCEAAVKADAKAFGGLLKHLKEVDGDTNTIIMVQIENEIGFLKSERDFSETANAAFSRLVPKVVEKSFGSGGDWECNGTI